MAAPTLSIVIPAYDEAARIGATLQATSAYLDARGVRAEVIVVDDGSRDGTCMAVEAVARVDPRVRLIKLGRNRGKGAAVREGILASRGERVLFMDADLATPMAELAKLEQALDCGAEVAIGSRALSASRIEVRQHPLREALGRAFNAVVRAVAVGGIHDTQCGFKLFTRRAADTLFREARVDRFAFDVEILLLARGRFRVAEVPVVWRHIERSKISPARDGARMAFDLLRLRLGVAMARRRATAGTPARGP
jgi:dolichyl-phosphate beta-glucosyltransferase